MANCHQLKLSAEDGKMRLTDVADTESLFRVIQSIPSPKAEPFKQWIAHVASERHDQIQDTELSIEQAMMDYKRLGYSDNWINQRLKSIEIRKDLTDQWKLHNVEEGIQYFSKKYRPSCRSHPALRGTRPWSGCRSASFRDIPNIRSNLFRRSLFCFRTIR